MLVDIKPYLDVLIFLLVSLIIVPICKRLNTSVVFGYLIAGAVLGPYGFAVVADGETSRLLAEFGIVFLLFTVGLELSWEKLRELSLYVFGMGSIQVVTSTALLGTLIYFIFQPDLQVAIVLGGALALSSTAIVVQLLKERNEVSTRTGRITLSILLFQDIFVVFLLIWISLLSPSDESVWSVLGTAILKASLVLIGIALLGRFVLRPLYRMVASTRSPELFMATTLLVILVISLATGMSGLSMELGGFLAGLILAETEYSHQIEADMRPFRNLLSGLFFITVGMAVNPAIFINEWRLILSAMGILLGLKVLLVFGSVSVFRYPLKTCIKTSLLLGGASEFVFVLIAEASNRNLMPQNLLQIINALTIITMASVPVLAILGRWLGRKVKSPIGYAIRRAEEDSKFLKNHIIIGGYGRVGIYVQRLLSKSLIPNVALDLNMVQVTVGREKKGASVFFGDVRRIQIYHALGAERARAILLTMSDFNTTLRAITVLKRFFPETPVYARAMDKPQALRLQKEGALAIMPESYVPSFQLSAAVLSLCGFSTAQIRQALQEFRQDYFGQAEFLGHIPWDILDRDMQATPNVISDVDG